jgi:hypothetical protein
VLWIRIRKDPDHFSGSGSVSYSNGSKKLKGRKNLTKNTFCVGPVGPTDKENQVKVCKKYCLRYITSLKGKDPDPYKISGFVSNGKAGSESVSK